MTDNMDNDLDAAIKASLAQYEHDQNKRHSSNNNIYSSSSSSSYQHDEDYQMAMALKLSATMWQETNNKNKKEENNKKEDGDDRNNNNILNDMSCDENENENGDNIDNEEEEEDEEDIDYEFDDDDDNNDDNAGDWGSDDDLLFDGDGQRIIEHKEYDEEDAQELMKRLMEKRRKEQSKIHNFWKCGKCQFLNHPSRAICMMCNMPQLDVVHHILICPKNQLKICIKCKAFVVPYLYDDHILDCKPFAGIDNEKNNQSWYVKLTPCEQNAINHVNSLAMKKSTDDKTITSLLQKISQISNGLYASQAADVLNKLYEFMEWTVPIIIRIKVASLIPILMKDTHYRSLFEINPSYKSTNVYNRNDARVQAEEKMFGPVYNKATVFERPKYGCLNVGLQPEGCMKAIGYGDGYFLMNDATVRWRTTMTIQDSFAVNGNCGTVKHCNHLLIQLQVNELQELIEAALYSKKGGKAQSTYREIQIHGPVQLNRDIISLNIPNTHCKYTST